jgi:hypothetical protein
MRSSRMIFTGTVMAAAVASGTAMTAGNTVPGSVAGYGEGMVSGAIVTNINYTALTADNTKLASVTFTTSTDITAQTGAGKTTMTLKSGATAGSPPAGGTPLRATPYVCGVGIAWTGTSMTVVCDTGDNPRFDAFTSVGLTVSQ